MAWRCIANCSAGRSLQMQTILPIRGCRDYTCGYRAYRVGLLKQAIAKHNGRLNARSGIRQHGGSPAHAGGHGGAIVGEVPLLLRYDFKRGVSKMRIFQTYVVPFAWFCVIALAARLTKRCSALAWRVVVTSH